MHTHAERRRVSAGRIRHEGERRDDRRAPQLDRLGAGTAQHARGLGGRGRAGRGRAESRGMMGGRGQAYRPFDAASGTHRSTRVLGEAHVQHLRSRTATKLKAADLARDIRTSVAASPVEQVRQRSRARSAAFRRLHRGTNQKIATGRRAMTIRWPCSNRERPCSNREHKSSSVMKSRATWVFIYPYT